MSYKSQNRERVCGSCENEMDKTSKLEMGTTII